MSYNDDELNPVLRVREIGKVFPLERGASVKAKSSMKVTTIQN
jgi:hypothetical protein